MTRKDVPRRFPKFSVSAAISAVLFALPAAGQPAPAKPPAPPKPAPAPAQPPPAPAPPAPPPPAAPAQPAPPAAPPAEPAPASGAAQPDATPAQAAASVEASPSAQVVATADAPPPAPERVDDLVPPGEKDRMKPRPVDPATMEFKPGRGLSIKSADGDFELALRARAQFLYTMTNSLNPATNERVTEQSFEVRRFRVTMQGAAFGVHNRYYLELGFGGQETVQAPTPGGSVSPLLDAYAEFDYLRDLTFRVGQYKPSFGRQRVMSEGNLQFVDVSRVTRDFAFDRDVGMDFRSKDFLGLNMLKYVVGVYTGQGRNSFAPSDFKMLYLARLEFLPLGLFEDYQESDHERTKPRLAIGTSLAHISAARRDGGSVGTVPADGGTTDMNLFQADAVFKCSGFSFQSEFFYRKGERNPGSAVDGNGDPIAVAPSRDGIGVYGQAGFLIPRMPLEVVARGGVISASEEAGHTGQAEWREVGGGLGYYFARHPLKLQSDFFRYWQKDQGDAGQNVFRLQLQVAL